MDKEICNIMQGSSYGKNGSDLDLVTDELANSTRNDINDLSTESLQLLSPKIALEPEAQIDNSSHSMLSVKNIVYISIASTLALILIVLIATFAGIYGYRVSQYVHCVDALEITPMDHALALTGTNTIQTGDLILFSSRLNALACIPTMVVTKSPITHIGVVVRNPATHLLYLVEVTLEGSRMRGCGIANLESRLSMYCGLILWRKLYNKTSVSPKHIHQQELDEKGFQLAQYCVQKNFGYRYSFLLTMWNRIGPPMTPMAVDFDNTVDEDWICTDLVAWMLEQLGIFLAAPVTLLPRDFHSLTQRLPMNPNFYYGPEIRLR